MRPGDEHDMNRRLRLIHLLGTCSKISNKWNHTRYRQPIIQTTVRETARFQSDLCMIYARAVSLDRTWWGPVNFLSGHKLEASSLEGSWVFRFQGVLTQTGCQKGRKRQLLPARTWWPGLQNWVPRCSRAGEGGNGGAPHAWAYHSPRAADFLEEMINRDKEGCDRSVKAEPASSSSSANPSEPGLHEHILDFLRAALEPEGGISWFSGEGHWFFKIKVDKQHTCWWKTGTVFIIAIFSGTHVRY